MTKDIKKYYHYLDLPYDASIEDVESRRKVLIKILRAKGMKKGVSYSEKIKKVAHAGQELIEFITNNGVQASENILFEIHPNDLIFQMTTLAVIIVLVIMSFVSLC